MIFGFLATLDVDSLNAVFTLYTITACSIFRHHTYSTFFLPTYDPGITSRESFTGHSHLQLRHRLTPDLHIHMHARIHADTYCRDIDGVSLQLDSQF